MELLSFMRCFFCAACSYLACSVVEIRGSKSETEQNEETCPWPRPVFLTICIPKENGCSVHFSLLNFLFSMFQESEYSFPIRHTKRKKRPKIQSSTSSPAGAKYGETNHTPMDPPPEGQERLRIPIVSPPPVIRMEDS